MIFTKIGNEKKNCFFNFVLSRVSAYFDKNALLGRPIDIQNMASIDKLLVKLLR